MRYLLEQSLIPYCNTWQKDFMLEESFIAYCAIKGLHWRVKEFYLFLIFKGYHIPESSAYNCEAVPRKSEGNPLDYIIVKQILMTSPLLQIEKPYVEIS